MPTDRTDIKLKQETDVWEHRREVLYGFVLFLFWPFLALLASAFNFGKKQYRYLVVLYFGFVGYTFMPTRAEDAYRNGEMLGEYNRGGTDLLIYKFSTAVEGESRIEIFRDILAYVLSIFTSDVGVYFGVWGMIYGVVFVLFIGKLYKEYKENGTPNINSLIFFLALVFYLPVQQVINGRFWLAFGFQLYFIYKIVVDKNHNYLLGMYLVALIHQAILIMAVVATMYVVSNLIEKKRNIVFYGLVVFAYAFQVVGIEFVRDVAIWMGGGFEKQVGGYIGYEDEARRAVAGIDTEDERSWFVVVRSYGLQYSLLATIAFTVFMRKIGSIKFDKATEHVYSFFLLFWAVHTFVAEVPAMGVRYLVMLNCVGIFLLFMIFRKYPGNYLHPIVLVFLPAYGLRFIVEWRIWFEWTSAMVLYSNPIFSFFVETETTIWDLIPM